MRSKVRPLLISLGGGENQLKTLPTPGICLMTPYRRERGACVCVLIGVTKGSRRGHTGELTSLAKRYCSSVIRSVSTLSMPSLITSPIDSRNWGGWTILIRGGRDVGWERGREREIDIGAERDRERERDIERKIERDMLHIIEAINSLQDV